MPRLRGAAATSASPDVPDHVTTGWPHHMPLPDYQTLMLPVLSAASRGEVRIGEVVDRLAEQLNLTPDERTALLPSGKQTIFSNRVHWAKTYLGKAGLIEATRRGHFKITARGAQVIAAHPERVDNAFWGNSRRSEGIGR